MTLFKAYLHEHAHFHCPPVNNHQTDLAAVNDIDLEVALSRFGVGSNVAQIAARHDPHMVDTLIKKLDEILGDCPLPETLKGSFEDRYDTDIIWDDVINKEVDARANVDRGPISMLRLTLAHLGKRIRVDRQVPPPDARSTVDFMLSVRTPETVEEASRKILVEIQASDVFFTTASKHPASSESDMPNCPAGFNISLNPPSGSNALKAFVHMSLYSSEWLALTCHTKWVFLRLHTRGPGEAPYLTYSAVEEQENNTRPFRALLAILLAVVGNIDAPSSVNLGEWVNDSENYYHT